MLEQLFRDESALARHRAGPFAEERERYLQHCAEHGATRCRVASESQRTALDLSTIYAVTHLRESIFQHFGRLLGNGDLCVKEPRLSND